MLERSKQLANVHRSHRDPDCTKVPTCMAKGKELDKLIEYYSEYKNNTNLFSNLTLSAHTRTSAPISRPPIVPPQQDFSSKTQLMRQHDLKDTFRHIYGIKSPSNLSRPAEVNDKYDCTVFEQKNPVSENIEEIRNTSMGGGTSYFYEYVKDPAKSNTRTNEKPFIRETIVRGELDHEFSLHNQLLKTSLPGRSLDPTKLSEDPLTIPAVLPFYCSKKKLYEGIKGGMMIY